MTSSREVLDFDSLSAQSRRAIASALLKRHRSRYYIRFNLRNGYNPETGKYNYAVWPILFKTREDAELAMRCLLIFKNADIVGLKSASVEHVVLDRPTWIRKAA